MNTVAGLLDSLGLSQYVATFEKNAIELEHLPELDHDTLKELGVRALGHRMTIMRAARALSDTPQLQQPDTAAGSNRHETALSGAEVERRQLSVMFCDLVNSVELGERMELEDYRTLLANFRNAVVAAIDQNDGFVARHQGDGVLAYFGYPRAHESDSERAVRAGLRIISAVAELDRANEVDVAVRVGIATGPVVVGDVLATSSSSTSEHAAFGSTPNLAARLQGQAAPNTLLVSNTTHRLVGTLFESIPSRELSLRGMAQKIFAFQIIGERARRYGVFWGDDTVPLIGRARELNLLRERWALARKGKGQVVTIAGASGLGKSRLLRATVAHVADETPTVLPFQCSAFRENSTLFPLIDWLNYEARIGFADSPERRRRKLRVRFRHYLTSASPYAGTVAALIDQACSIADNEFDISPQSEPRLDRLVQILTDSALEKPVLLFIEDFHWSDPTTAMLIEQIIRQITNLPVLLLITYRRSPQIELERDRHVAHLTLTALNRQDSEALVRMTAKNQIFEAELVNQICERSDGIPLFLEEITRVIEETRLDTLGKDDATAPDHHELLTVPERLQGLLMARLDRLGPAKQIAQIAAIIGRRFEQGLLEALVSGSPDTLGSHLATLTRSDIISRLTASPGASYAFNHALVQETAYQSLLKSVRARYHGLCAQALVELFPQVALTSPDQVAHHYAAARMPAEAIGYWVLAGRRALARSAGREALQSIDNGLKLIAGLDSGAEQDRLELTLRVIQGSALLMSRGQGTAEVERAYARALELAQRTGDDATLFPALLGTWRYYIGNASLAAARQVAERLLAVAQAIGSPVHNIVARMALANTCFHGGYITQALAHAQDGLAAYRSEQRDQEDARLFLIGQDPVVSLEFCAAFAHWLTGDRQAAESSAERGLALARTLDQPYSLGMALVWTGLLGQRAGDLDTVSKTAAELLRLSERHELPWCHGMGLASTGWVLVQQGQAEQGLETLQSGITVLENTGVGRFTFYSYGLLADAYRILDRPESGLQTMERALQSMNETGVRWDAPRMQRLQAQLALLTGDREMAEACLHASIAGAREMSMGHDEKAARIMLAQIHENI